MLESYDSTIALRSNGNQALELAAATNEHSFHTKNTLSQKIVVVRRIVNNMLK